MLAHMHGLTQVSAVQLQHAPMNAPLCNSAGCGRWVLVQETEPYLNVGKRISLFLARKSPQHTIDTLVYEVKKMRDDDDALVTPKAGRFRPVLP